MGWNDRVCWVETECLKCGTICEWEYWDGKGRCCPECGSTEGVAVPVLPLADRATLQALGLDPANLIIPTHRGLPNGLAIATRY